MMVTVLVILAFRKFGTVGCAYISMLDDFSQLRFFESQMYLSLICLNEDNKVLQLKNLKGIKTLP